VEGNWTGGDVGTLTCAMVSFVGKPSQPATACVKFDVVVRRRWKRCGRWASTQGIWRARALIGRCAGSRDPCTTSTSASSFTTHREQQQRRRAPVRTHRCCPRPCSLLTWSPRRLLSPSPAHPGSRLPICFVELGERHLATTPTSTATSPVTDTLLPPRLYLAAPMTATP
jgi:hypothetical protein